jgi:hypothetical protein
MYTISYQKRYPEAVNRRTDNTLAKRKMTKRETMVYKNSTQKIGPSFGILDLRLLGTSFGIFDLRLLGTSFGILDLRLLGTSFGILDLRLLGTYFGILNLRFMSTFFGILDLPLLCQHTYRLNFLC